MSHANSFCLDELTKAYGLDAEVYAAEIKYKISHQIISEMKQQQLKKSTLAKRMNTSRAALDRLLDEDDTGLTLVTLVRAVNVLGKKLTITIGD